ncbi:MAG: accessory factor UbiK family protein [Rhodospirillaceae bacterium]|jgi:BMFP domain-containing protein YqiC|nr:accessory factor UbiK family protein [Rhodospirillaceae bacterium]MDD9924480.1 accessory factor UbiK family protein [Rhodospirillaceae bacterium]
MQVDNRFLDDLARVANGAVGALSGVREEVEAMVRQRAERLLADMDLVTREEFEAVKAVAAKARLEQEALEDRVATLEAALAELQKPKRSKTKATGGKKASAPK